MVRLRGVLPPLGVPVDVIVVSEEYAHKWADVEGTLVGIAGNALAARVRLSGGRRLDSPALIADGHHARSDAFVSAGVVLSSLAVAAGAPIADPLIGIAITILILRITWESWNTVRGHRHHH